MMWQLMWCDVAADVAQHENSRIKRYASTFSNILVANPCDAQGSY